MSLATSLLNKVTPLQQGGNFGAISGINLNDTTFSDLLDKAINVQPENKINDTPMQLGAPLGFEIQELKLDEIGATDKIDKNLLEFAQKQASNNYFKCSGSVVTDLTEFVEDALTKKVTNFIASPM